MYVGGVLRCSQEGRDVSGGERGMEAEGDEAARGRGKLVGWLGGSPRRLAPPRHT